MKPRCPKCRSELYLEGEPNIGFDGEIEINDEYFICENNDCDFEILKNSVIWITRDGRVMAMKNITNDHLNNIITFLLNKQNYNRAAIFIAEKNKRKEAKETIHRVDIHKDTIKFDDTKNDEILIELPASQVWQIIEEHYARHSYANVVIE